jgi:branched-chain amino acid transport system permease protein
MLTADVLLQALISGLLMGGIYALIAVALAVVFGVMRVLNFAHGDLLMVAMYGTVLLHQAFGINPYLSSLILFPAMMLLGWLIFKILIKPVLGAGVLMQAQLTLGLSFAIQSVILIAFGADLFNVQTKFGNAGLRLWHVVVSEPLLLGSSLSLLVSLALSWVLTRTELGYRIRATAQDPLMAALCGVPVPRIRALVFAGSVGVLAIAAGCLMTFYYVTSFVGIQFTVLSLLIVVLGGLGDLRGAFVGGIVVGIVESLSSAIVNSAAAPAVIYVLFGVALLMRPRGIFGRGSVA